MNNSISTLSGGKEPTLTAEKIAEMYKALKPIGDKIITHARADDFHYYQVAPKLPIFQNNVTEQGIVGFFYSGFPVYHDRRVKGMLFYRKDGTKERFIHFQSPEAKKYAWKANKLLMKLLGPKPTGSVDWPNGGI